MEYELTWIKNTSSINKDKVYSVISNYTKYAISTFDNQDEDILRQYRLIRTMLDVNGTDTTLDERIDLTYRELTKDLVSRQNKLKKI